MDCKCPANRYSKPIRTYPWRNKSAKFLSGTASLLIPPDKGLAVNKMVNIELGNSDQFQLYDLAEDTGQQKNLASDRPDLLQELLSDFEKQRGMNYSSTRALELK